MDQIIQPNVALDVQDVTKAEDVSDSFQNDSDLFEQINEKKVELDNIIRDYGEKAIKGYLREFWKQNPRIKSIKWVQYTPYFNDGDPCVFGVNDVRAKLEGIGEEDGGDYEDGHYDSWSFGYELMPDAPYEQREQLINDQYPELVALNKLNGIWQNNEQTLLTVFGDHAEITATPEKIEVDEYYHD